MAYNALNKDILGNYNIIINTTPLGTFPYTDACPEIPYQHLNKEHLLFDLVYNPEKTLFLSKGEEQGASIVNGYQMLVFQAEGSWDRWSKS